MGFLPAYIMPNLLTRFFRTTCFQWTGSRRASRQKRRYTQLYDQISRSSDV